jgi:hypothetical protein
MCTMEGGALLVSRAGRTMTVFFSATIGHMGLAISLAVRNESQIVLMTRSICSGNR